MGYEFIFEKKFLFISTIVAIVANIMICPDLLNHRDIRINDMSYLIPSVNLNVKENVNSTLTSGINEQLQENSITSKFY